MIKKSIEKAINEQINAELYSAYLYLSMAAYFETANLPGAANWMRCQVQEEIAHAMKFYDFVIERGGKVILTAIEGPETSWASPLAVFEAGLKHERKVTARINALVDLAIKEKDHAANAMLQWFVTEQVEEESSAEKVIQQLRLCKGEGSGLFMIDRELAARVFTPPAAPAE